MIISNKLKPLAVAAPLALLAAVPSAIAQTSSREAPAVYNLGPVEVVGDDANHLLLGVGAFNVIPNDGPENGVYHDDTTIEGRIEYRLGQKAYGFGPMLGLMANGDGGVFGYGALYTDLRIGDWYVTPSAGLGGYHRGDGKELGGVFAFHLGLDVGYRLEDGSRIGFKMTHISNAYTQEHNPGVESALLTYTIPFDAF